MRGAALALLTAGLFLGGILVGVGFGDEPAVPAPEVVRLVDQVEPAPSPTRSPKPSPTPAVERVEREVDYGDIEDYEDRDRRAGDGRERDGDRERDDDERDGGDRERDDDEERSGDNGEEDEPEGEKDDD